MVVEVESFTGTLLQLARVCIDAYQSR